MISFWTLSRADALTALDAYVDTLAPLEQRLYDRVSRTDGPSLDRSRESLILLGEWFAVELRTEREDGLRGLPVWWGDSPVRGDMPDRHIPFNSIQLRLIDEVQAYVGAVMKSLVPSAQWVAFQDPHPRDFRNGSPSLQLAAGTDPVQILDLTYVMALQVLRGAPIDSAFLATSTTKGLEDAGLIEAATTAAPEPVEASTYTGEPEDGDIVIHRGRHSKYLKSGPTSLPALDEAIARRVLGELGATLERKDGDEGDWNLDTLIWEVWLERDADGILRAIGWDTHFDQNLTSQDAHTAFNGVITLAKALKAKPWAALEDVTVLTPTYRDRIINELLRP